MNNAQQQIESLAKRVADEQGVELFDIELLGKGKLLLRVAIDKEGGVTLDDCERFSKSLGALLDVEDVIHRTYTLEVSSPGLDRPLRSLREFERNKGKLARIVTVEKIENQNFLVGRIAEVKDDGLVTLMVDDHAIDIPYDKIAKARLEIEL
jgi:ribosome maturation factor RimP